MVGTVGHVVTHPCQRDTRPRRQATKLVRHTTAAYRRTIKLVVARRTILETITNGHFVYALSACTLKHVASARSFRCRFADTRAVVLVCTVTAVVKSVATARELKFCQIRTNRYFGSTQFPLLHTIRFGAQPMTCVQFRSSCK